MICWRIVAPKVPRYVGRSILVTLKVNARVNGVCIAPATPLCPHIVHRDVYTSTRVARCHPMVQVVFHPVQKPETRVKTAVNRKLQRGGASEMPERNKREWGSRKGPDMRIVLDEVVRC